MKAPGCAQMADRAMYDGHQHFMDHLQNDLQIDLGFQGRSGGAREDPQPAPNMETGITQTGLRSPRNLRYQP